jgi:phosphoribosylformimino-5-aminoimidazole carboxamide ribotide isomerase
MLWAFGRVSGSFVPAVPHLQEDLERVRAAGQGRVDITVGSALDIFGGKLKYSDVVAWHQAQQQQAVKA